MLPPHSELAQPSPNAALHIYTLGGFRVRREGEEIDSTAWGREKAVQLFQFFVTTRGKSLHKEQIVDQLWPELSIKASDRDFKVALHAVNKTLEPERKRRSDPRFIQRNDLTYGLNLEEAWIDIDAFESLITLGNQFLPDQPEQALSYYQSAIELYQGEYLPERRYADWCSAERERLQVLALNMMTTVAGLLVEQNPLESIRLTQRVLALDPVWEDAYRTQMRAYYQQGNRPLALRTYQQCVEQLVNEFGIDPLPETKALFEQILRTG